MARGILVFLSTASLASAVVAACGQSAGPSGKGDDIFNDTRDSSVRAPANPDDGAAPTGQPDGGFVVYEPDGAIEVGYPDGSAYPGVAACGQCTCPAAHLYCFGGAPPQMQVRPAPAGLDAASDAPTDDAGSDANPLTDADADAGSDAAVAKTKDAAAGSTACPVESAGAIGCTALPASCTNQNEAEDCPCLLALLQPLYDCPLDCTYNGKTSTVYCPNR